MSNVVDKIGNIGVLPVVNVPKSDLAVPLAEALMAGGINALEVTLRSADSLESIKAIKQAHPEMVLGAGTVLNIETAKKALEAGADYIVSPGYDKELVAFCIENNVPIVPGCVTPSEIQDGIKQGLTVFKFFPAELNGGVDALKLISGPFPQAKFVPTGGITFDNLGKYLSLPCVLACGGSFMAPAAAVKNGEFDKISELCKKSMDISLGFELAHVGVNCENGEIAETGANSIGDIFRLPVKVGNSSVFAGTAVEFMKTMYYGTKGHIGFKTNSMDRALAYLRNSGVEIIEESIRRDDKGKLVSAYLKNEIGGFAVHIVRK